MPVTESSFGVYVHVPWCRRLCPYCDFNVHIAPRRPWTRFGAAIDAELRARAGLFATPAASLYFGGGTPSLAPAAWIRARREAVATTLGLAPGAEVTVEADPGTIDAAGLAELRAVGVTRLSLGWQSTHDRLLRVLGRGHTAAESRRLIDDARAVGFSDLSVDLIFAVPGQSVAELDADLDAVLASGVPHVSLYALTYHAGTELDRRRKAGRVVPIDEDTEVTMQERIAACLVSAGFEQYEVANFARPDRRAVHNQVYWRGGPYLGLGPGAHSFHRCGWEQGQRWENRREPHAYIDAWDHPPPHSEPTAGPALEWVEHLTPEQLVRERFLTGLRTSDGVDLDWWPATRRAHLAARVDAVVAAGWARARGKHLVPTAHGMLMADSLALAFF